MEKNKQASNSILQHRPINPRGLQQNEVPSQMYFGIHFRANPSQRFLTLSNQISKQLKTIKAPDYRIGLFYSATLKLFKEICSQFTINDLWICQQRNNQERVYVYFIEAKKFPIMLCCRQNVYLQFQPELYGNARCIECKKIGFSFVHIPKKNSTHKYKKHVKKQNKQNNFVQADQNIQKQSIQNEKLYKYCKKQNQNKKHTIRKLISSNQHRYRSIKKIMSTTSDKIYKLQENQQHSIYKNNKIEGNKTQTQQKTIMKQLQIGQFIIEILGMEKNKIMENCCNKFNKEQNIYGNQAEKQKAEQQGKQQLTQSQQQLKKIILEFFN